MLKALTILALTNAASTDNTLSTVALGVAILALLVAMMALSRARRTGDAARTAEDEALAATPAGSAAAGTVAGTLAPEDDRQLVAVLTAAVAAVMADEQGAGAPAPKITGIRQVGAATAAAAAPAAPAGNGPYAGFTVRRIRRV